ncbi:MAG: TerB family tellurite resistance protein [Myxococcales bacterium]|nr:TerB family tellurite resistance protein [Myxococcales bacterium]
MRIVTAIAGLLAVVAYADREYSQDERARIRADLARLHTLPPEGVDAICHLVDRAIVELGTANSQNYTRDLRELVEVELRREVLDVLVDLAASDGEISLSESDLLRRTAASLGLTQDDYNSSQKRHNDRLSVLK